MSNTIDTQHFKDLLRNRELKATNPRLKLLMKMHEFESAMPYSAIQESMESMDRVTLYRTIESLKKKGIIHKAYQENNDVYYAICGTGCGTHAHRHDHIHFKCEKCDLVTCKESVKNVQLAIPDHLINKVNIHVEGICPACL